MKTYFKPELDVKSFESVETFADLYGDIFGTGTSIPISTYTLGDSSSL